MLRAIIKATGLIALVVGLSIALPLITLWLGYFMLLLIEQVQFLAPPQIKF